MCAMPRAAGPRLDGSTSSGKKGTSLSQIGNMCSWCWQKCKKITLCMAVCGGIYWYWSSRGGQNEMDSKTPDLSSGFMSRSHAKEKAAPKDNRKAELKKDTNVFYWTNEEEAARKKEEAAREKALQARVARGDPKAIEEDFWNWVDGN